MRYDYDKALTDVKEYIESFRGNNYYASVGGTEVLDLLRSEQMLESFGIGNIVKYVIRLGKKDVQKKEDMMKVFHYMIILLILEDPDRYEVKES